MIKKPTRMIAELMEAKQDADSFKLAIFMAAGVNNEVAMDMRIGVLPKLTEKVEKIQRDIDDLVKTHHILFETPFYEEAHILLFRDGKTIVKTYDLHDFKDRQDWALTRAKERFDDAQESDDEGYYWAIVRYDCHLGSVDIATTWICHFALTSEEGISLHRQLNEWQNERLECTEDSPNYVYLPEPILCHVCTAHVSQLHKKIISGYIYQYCSSACAESDFTMCSSCGEAEISKKDCDQKSFGCCQQYLGGNLQYYCSGRCEGEDTTDFIRSFSKK